MPMQHIYEYHQSQDRFELASDGACQALSARWIVARAGWDRRRDAEWTCASWMGDRQDLEQHVSRIYTATRAARAAVELEERRKMEEVTKNFNTARRIALSRQRRTVTSAAARSAASLIVASPSAAAAASAATTTDLLAPGYSLADLDALHSRVYIPATPRVLEALRKDIEQHSGLEGADHTYSDVACARVALTICALGEGYNLVVLRDPNMSREGGAHAIAIEIHEGETRLFDPNYGEYRSDPGGHSWEALGVALYVLLVREYGLESVRDLAVIHFPFKPAGR